MKVENLKVVGGKGAIPARFKGREIEEHNLIPFLSYDDLDRRHAVRRIDAEFLQIEGRSSLRRCFIRRRIALLGVRERNFRSDRVKTRLERRVSNSFELRRVEPRDARSMKNGAKRELIRVFRRGKDAANGRPVIGSFRRQEHRRRNHLIVVVAKMEIPSAGAFHVLAANSRRKAILSARRDGGSKLTGGDPASL